MKGIIVIRKLSSSDAGKLKKIHKSSICHSCSDYSESIKDVWTSGTIEDMARCVDNALYAIGYEDNNDLLGYALIRHNLTLWHLYVAPLAQSKGVGTTLLEEVESFLKKEGVKRLVLDSNTNAVSFYLKKGFSKEQEKVVLMRDKEVSAVEMCKILD